MDGRTPDRMGQEIIYAGFWVRLAAYAIDSVIVFAGLLIVRIVLLGMSPLTDGTFLGGNILFHYTLKDMILYGVQVFYFILCTYHSGTTPGKRVMNLRVVSAGEEEKLGLLNVIYRETVGRFLSGLVLCIGYIIIGIDKEKRGLHDMLCDTRVIYGRRIKIYPMYQTPPAFRGTSTQPGGVPPMQPRGGVPPMQPGRCVPPVPSDTGMPSFKQGQGVPRMVPPVYSGSGTPPVPKAYPPNVPETGGAPVQKEYPPNLSGSGASIFEQPFQNTSIPAPEVPHMPEGGYRMIRPEENGESKVLPVRDDGNAAADFGETTVKPEEDTGEPLADGSIQPDENRPEQADIQEERDS